MELQLAGVWVYEDVLCKSAVLGYPVLILLKYGLIAESRLGTCVCLVYWVWPGISHRWDPETSALVDVSVLQGVSSIEKSV